MRRCEIEEILGLQLLLEIGLYGVKTRTTATCRYSWTMTSVKAGMRCFKLRGRGGTDSC